MSSVHNQPTREKKTPLTSHLSLSLSLSQNQSKLVDSFYQNNNDKVVHDKTREAHKERDRQKEKKEGSKKHKPNMYVRAGGNQ